MSKVLKIAAEIIQGLAPSVPLEMAGFTLDPSVDLLDLLPPIESCGISSTATDGDDLFVKGFYLVRGHEMAGWKLNQEGYLCRPEFGGMELHNQKDIVGWITAWYAVRNHLQPQAGSNGCELCKGAGKVSALFLGGDKPCPNKECTA